MTIEAFAAYVDITGEVKKKKKNQKAFAVFTIFHELKENHLTSAGLLAAVSSRGAECETQWSAL